MYLYVHAYMHVRNNTLDKNTWNYHQTCKEDSATILKSMLHFPSQIKFIFKQSKYRALIRVLFIWYEYPEIISVATQFRRYRMYYENPAHVHAPIKRWIMVNFLHHSESLSNLLCKDIHNAHGSNWKKKKTIGVEIQPNSKIWEAWYTNYIFTYHYPFWLK